jgi:hypothetical protein
MRPVGEGIPTLSANGREMGTPRAMRYGIGTSIQYRVRGEHKWCEGTMQNISTTGVLLGTDRLLNIGDTIEMRFVLPVQLEGERAAEVLCRGLVIRAAPDAESASTINVGARILNSRLLRQTSPRQ